MIIISAVTMGLIAICLYCTTLFANRGLGSKAQSMADAISCQKGASWSSEHSFNISSPIKLPLWGSYRPGVYFGMKTRTPMALSTGILWSGSNEWSGNLRHQTNQDELTQFEWVQHDGKNYGQQNLLDRSHNLALNTTFVVKEVEEIAGDDVIGVDDEDTDRMGSEEESSWVQRINVKSIEKNSRKSQKSLYFYLGFEGAETEKDTMQRISFLSEMEIIGGSQHIRNSIEGDKNEIMQLVTVLGKSELSGYFRLMISITSLSSRSLKLESGTENDEFSITYLGLQSGDVSDGVDYLTQSYSSIQNYRGMHDNDEYDTDGKLKNVWEENVNFIVLQIKSEEDFVFDAIFYENIQVNNIDSLQKMAENEMEIYGLEFSTTQKNSEDENVINVKVTNSSPMESKEVKIETLKSSESANKALSVKSIDKWIKYYSDKFNEKFEDIYKLQLVKNQDNDAYFSARDIFAAKAALSSLLGGVGYFHGSPKIGNALDMLPLRTSSPNAAEQEIADKYHQLASEKIAQSASELVRGSPIGLLSATPSRTSFPRGFLWDEGFHLLVISQWDIGLTMTILSHWVNSMYHCSLRASSTDSQAVPSNCVGGWIPREMILGKDSEKRVPDEFITQRIDIANPPTLMLVIDKLLDKINENEDAINFFENGNNLKKSNKENLKTKIYEVDIKGRRNENKQLLSFLNDIYPALDSWIDWFRNSQKGPVGDEEGEDTVRPDGAAPHINPEGSYRWRGRALPDKKLIANTLSSGLDDFPRSPLPSDKEFHVDLFCWIGKAAAVMKRLEFTLKKSYIASNSLKLKAIEVEVDMEGFGGIIQGNKEEEKTEGKSSEKVNGNTSKMINFSSKYEELSEYLMSRLEALHWSDTHRAFLDVGFTHDLTVISTEVVMQCGDPLTFTAIQIQIPFELAKSGTPFCPEPYNQFIGVANDGHGGAQTKLAYRAPGPLDLKHVPRIGYVSLFPFLLNVIPIGSDKLRSILDIIESPDLLWSNYGLRSIAKNDTFYGISNEPGDEPYWRGPIWMNINYLALQALHHYGTSDYTLEMVTQNMVERKSNERRDNKKKRQNKNVNDQQINRENEIIFYDYLTQKKRSLRLYHELRKNIQTSVLSNYHETGFFWEHYEDLGGKGTRGHPFTGWTALIINIMAEM